MDIEGLVEHIKSSSQHRYVYHFTDESNLPTIREFGILSKSELNRRGVEPLAYGGNQWSHDADQMKGLQIYVNLCLTRNHPMCYVAKNEGRVANPRYLEIEPRVLLKPNVMIAFDVANKSGVAVKPLCDAVDEIDMEVIYSRTDWSEPSINQRLRTAEKYEILIPHCIPVCDIKGLY